MSNSNRNVGMSHSAARELRTFLLSADEYVANNKEGEYGVYVLECIQTFENDERMREFLREETTSRSEAELRDHAENVVEENEYYNSVDSVVKNLRNYPDYYDAAIAADRVLYVGQTNNVPRRIREHISGEGTTFTNLFPPRKLTDIHWADTRSAAKQLESDLSEELDTMTHRQYKAATREWFANTFDVDRDLEDWQRSKIRSELGEDASEEDVINYALTEIYGRPEEVETDQDTVTFTYSR